MKSEPVEVTAASLCRLLGITPNTLSDLSKRGIVVKGEKRGSYLLQPSVTQYCQYLRALGVGTSDGEVTARQARNVQLHSVEMPVGSEEKRRWTKLWNFRNSFGSQTATVGRFKSMSRMTGGIRFTSNDLASDPRSQFLRPCNAFRSRPPPHGLPASSERRRQSDHGYAAGDFGIRDTCSVDRLHWDAPGRP